MYLFRLSALKEINKMFSAAFDFTMKKRTRDGHDTALPFLHANYLIREGLGMPLFEHPDILDFNSITHKLTENNETFHKLASKSIPFVVLNDQIKNSIKKKECSLHVYL